MELVRVVRDGSYVHQLPLMLWYWRARAQPVALPNHNDYALLQMSV